MKYLFFLVCLSIFSTLGFNIIPLNKALIEHKRALKEFEKYTHLCKAEVYNYGNITEYDYQFCNKEAKQAFEDYRRAQKDLLSKNSINYILMGILVSIFSSTYNVVTDTFPLDNKKIIFFDILAAIYLEVYENKLRSAEPYISLGNFKKYKNIYGNDIATSIFLISSLYGINLCTQFITYGMKDLARSR